MIKEYIGISALFEQFAEECCELAQASLKYARKLREENPTPKTEKEILDNFHEELADVLVCIDEIGLLIDYDKVFDIKKEKTKRWYKRIGVKDND